MKFFILDKLFPFFKYKQVERLLSVFEKYLLKVSKQNSYLVKNVNPIRTAVQILEFSQRIGNSYHVTDFRVNHIKDNMINSLNSMFVKLYYPTEIKEQVKKKDIFGVDALSYMEKMNSYDVMDTKIMDRIMKEYWTSNFD